MLFFVSLQRISYLLKLYEEIKYTSITEKKGSCPCFESCFLQKAMSTIGGKWKLPVLCSLTANGTTRYNDLLRNIKGISNTMLSKSLRELEDDELIKRFEYLEIPVRVEYALTEKAVRLQPILLELIQWEIARETKTSSCE
ncbi:MAG: helix-turn-helix transcriptional regulator [Lachnospiraceae bacterium]|nr:helix-turn-helix transcriptional regulator [Lachnospiraceae bacterium]